GPKVFDSIAARKPLLFVCGGDFHYMDITTNDAALFRAAIAQQLAMTSFGLAFRHVPIAYMPDDHDYGPDNSDRTSPSRTASLASYRQVVPHYPLDAAPDATRHQAWTFGRVRHILTDLRS